MKPFCVVDEIFESGSLKIKNSLTSVEQAERFFRETGVDLIVPNLGTEHRATQEKIKYASSQAKKSGTLPERLWYYTEPPH